MLSILFPSTCHVCGHVLARSEQFICAGCLTKLPRVNFASSSLLNTMEELFTWLPNVERCDTFMHYRPKTPSARLLADIKYNGYSRMARYLGRLMGEQALEHGLLAQVDAVVPVPLHWLKYLRRGYNQCYQLALGIADVVNIPVQDVLTCKWHKTQTRLSESARHENVKNIYGIRKDVNLPARVLLIDDVCTTGSTLGAIARVIEQHSPHTRIRIMSLALTDR